MKTCKEKAAEWGISYRSVNNMCKNKKIPGAVKVNSSWQIPDDATKPTDGRISSGKYIKKSIQIERKALPIGISDYVRAQSEYYYVDKTLLIKDFLDQKPLVSLFTRPRRFGKTLNMSMLHHFFEIGSDQTLFDGLYISDCVKLCEVYMGKFPVIFLSLKGVDGLSFDAARYRLTEVIGREARRFSFLQDSCKLTEADKSIYRAMTALQDGQYTMNQPLLESALKTLSELLCKHYGQKVIILIDEYDVPLAKASSNGYYKEMLEIIKIMMSTALKDNPAIKFAIVTGCLRIAKESIFTGTNNFVSDTITSSELNEFFGFTQKEVNGMLADVDAEGKADEVKKWYDGYQLGKYHIYNPNAVVSLMMEGEFRSYWSETGSYRIIVPLINMDFDGLKSAIIEMLAGGSVETDVTSFQNDTVNFEDKDDILTYLIHLGYLAYDQKREMAFVPNEEIREELFRAVKKKKWNEFIEFQQK